MEVVAVRPSAFTDHSWFFYLQCPRCRGPVSAEIQCVNPHHHVSKRISLYGGASRDLVHPPEQGDILVRGWRLKHLWPPTPKPTLPEHLPPEVARPYLAAERNYPQHGMEEAAAGSYGRALEVGTKLFASQHAEQKLNNRIDKMRKDGLITQSLWEWAHMIKSIRNDALHEVDSIDREELKAIRGFTETLLTYLFTLPGMLAERRTAAQAGLSEPTPSDKQ